MAKQQNQPSSQSIHTLFEPASFFRDLDGDGFFDALDLTIRVHPDVTRTCVWAALLNLTARIGFELVTLETDFMVVADLPSTNNPYHITILPEGAVPPHYPHAVEPSFIWKASATEVYIGGSDHAALAELITDLAIDCETVDGGIDTIPEQDSSPAEAGLPLDPLDLIQSLLLYQPSTVDSRKICFNGSMRLLGEHISPNLGTALVNALNHLLLDATDIRLPIVSSTAPHLAGGVEFLIEEIPGKKDGLQITQPDAAGRTILAFRGSGPDLISLLNRWLPLSLCRPGQEDKQAEYLRNTVRRAVAMLNGSGYRGQWAHWLTHPESASSALVPVHPSHYQAIQDAMQALGIKTPLPRDEYQPVFREVSWESETEQLLKLVENVPEGDGPIFGRIFISKPLPTRQALHKTICDLLIKKGYHPQVTLFNAFKPGLSWLLEKVLPELQTLPDIKTLVIRCQPFSSREGTLEAKSRWLEELYPGIDLLRERLAIDDQQIQVEWEKPIAAVYQIRALGANQDVLFDESLTPYFHQISYLPAAETPQWVHPGTGHISLKTDRHELINERIATDREQFWKILQTQWLPTLTAAMQTRLQEENPEQQIAFWETLEIRVEIEETEVALDLDSERISPMEALQEDIYFVLLDFCTDFIARHHLSPTLQFGQIIPHVTCHLETGKPNALLKALPQPWLKPPDPERASNMNKIAINAIALENNRWQFQLKPLASQPDEGKARALSAIARAWDLDMSWQTGSFHLLVPETEQVGPSDQPEPIPTSLPKDRPLTIRETAGKMAHLSQQPGLRLHTIARSLQNRPIRILEATSITSDAAYSAARLRMVKPSILFNGRHHANEVSATTATLDLAEYLVSTETGNRWRKDYNLLLSPLENMDGANLLETLLPDCPNYMLHAARFNALGVEFASEYFKETCLFPEAQAKTRIWKKWLPELVVDQHGVPDHEWCQPFSGYLPKRFDQYWIPRTFAYVILPYLTTPDHPHHALALTLVAKLNNAMKQEEDIQALNRKLAKRYNLYARRPEPGIFPPSDGEPMLAVPNLPRLNNTNSAMLFPEITKCEIVVEVPDEVVTGQRFERCVKANRIVQKTLIEALPSAKGQFTAHKTADHSQCRLSWISYLGR